MQLLRDIPFTAIFWTLTETIRGPLLRSAAQRGPHGSPAAGSAPAAAELTPSSWQLIEANSLAAGVSGSVAAAATTPFDVIKTQQQVVRGGSGQTLLETARRIVAQSGYRGLWAGLVPRSVRAFPSGAMVVTTYELLKQHFAARRG